MKTFLFFLLQISLVTQAFAFGHPGGGGHPGMGGGMGGGFRNWPNPGHFAPPPQSPPSPPVFHGTPGPIGPVNPVNPGGHFPGTVGPISPPIGSPGFHNGPIAPHIPPGPLAPHMGPGSAIGGSAQPYYHPNGSLAYTYRPVYFNNHEFHERTYMVRGFPVVRYYQPFYFGPVPYYAYVPEWRFRPVFYGFVLNPWPRPIFYPFAWSVTVTPWFGFYGYYYRPFVYYPSAAYWITDFILASYLAQQYAIAQIANEEAEWARAEALSAQASAEEAAAYRAQAAAAAQSALLTENTKKQLAAQTQDALEAHQRSESISLQTLLADPGKALNHLFVVPATLNINATRLDTQTNCTISGGDIIKFSTLPDNSDEVATMVVDSAKNESCLPQSQIHVSVQNLQEIMNEYSRHVDQAMQQIDQRLMNESGTRETPAN